MWHFLTDNNYFLRLAFSDFSQKFQLSQKFLRKSFFLRHDRGVERTTVLNRGADINGKNDHFVFLLCLTPGGEAPVVKGFSPMCFLSIRRQLTNLNDRKTLKPAPRCELGRHSTITKSTILMITMEPSSRFQRLWT